MIKTIALLKMKAGLTRAQFIDYYETRHVPLILSIAPQICGYRRNFIEAAGAIQGAAAAARDFDCVTELWFPDAVAFAAAMAAFADPANAERIAADEENVFERSFTRFFAVEEHVCPGLGQP
jgi:EthD domain